MIAFKFSDAAQRNIDELAVDPESDRAEIIRDGTTEAEFLAFCLDGADPDRRQGWRDYAREIFRTIAGDA